MIGAAHAEGAVATDRVTAKWLAPEWRSRDASLASRPGPAFMSGALVALLPAEPATLGPGLTFDLEALPQRVAQAVHRAQVCAY